MSISYIADWREMYARTVEVLTGPEPLFYGRIGGSDTDMVIDFLKGVMMDEDEAALLARLRPHHKIVEAYNGYYDKSREESKLLDYARLLVSCYDDLRFASLVGGKWLTRYFPGNINPIYKDEIQDGAEVYDYMLQRIERKNQSLSLLPFPFIEKTTSHQLSMFNAFQQILPGKKVLVLCPFSQSIVNNYPNRHRFFKNYDYPEFDLLAYRTPITYSGLPDELYPDSDWFETVDRMIGDISGLDFDIALLSCGSYAMPIGRHIAQSMGKKAIYIGGVLQLYFGIMGRRYENPFFLNQIDQGAFVKAEERELYFKFISVNPNAAAEGFGAYL